MDISTNNKLNDSQFGGSGFSLLIATIMSLSWMLFSIHLFAQTNQSAIQNITGDASFTVNVGGNKDNKRLQQYVNYYVLGNPLYNIKRPYEPLDTLEILNTHFQELQQLSVYFNNKNWNETDSIASYAIKSAPAGNTEDSVWNIFNSVFNNHYYYYVPELGNNQKEINQITNHFGVYGYGHCGSINNCVATIARRLTNKPQRLWSILGGAHGIAEVNLRDSDWVYVDADKGSVSYKLDNKTLASFGEVYEDLYLFGRVKRYSPIEPYPWYANQELAESYFLQHTDHTYSDAIINDSSSSDIQTQFAHSLLFDLKPNELIRFFSSKQDTIFHHVITPTYGSYPGVNDVQNCIRTGEFVWQPLNADSTVLSNCFSHIQNVTIANGLYRKIKPAANGVAECIITKNSPFPFISGFISFDYKSLYPQDSILIYYSNDSVNWQPLGYVFNSTGNYQYNFSNRIAPLDSAALYKYFLKIKFTNQSGFQQSEVSNLFIKNKFQTSSFYTPRLSVGANAIHLDSKNNSIHQATVKLAWKEETVAIPQAPTAAIYPPDNSTISNTDILFNWAMGAYYSVDFQMQLSEYSDFRHVLTTNYNNYTYYKYGSNAPVFQSEIYDFFRNNKTYYWRVRSRNVNDIVSNWSNTWSFTIHVPEHPLNVHFENVLGDSVQLKWTTNPNGQTPDSFAVYASNTAQGFEPKPDNFFRTVHSNIITVSLNGKDYYRIKALNSNKSPSSPSHFVEIPEVMPIQNGDIIDVVSMKEQLQHPFPNYPSLQRDYVTLFDTTFFHEVNGNLIAKLPGQSLVSIIYLDENGLDTVYKKQIFYKIYNYLIKYVSCEAPTETYSFNIPLSMPYSLYYEVDNMPYVKVINDQNDTVAVDYATSIYFDYAVKNDTTLNINRAFLNEKPPAQVTLIPEGYNCDSSKYQLKFAASGVKPYTLNYVENGNPVALTFSLDTLKLFLPNGFYSFSSLQDFSGCLKPINQNFAFNYEVLSCNTSQPIYDCDSAATKIHFELEGNSPWNIHYLENGVPKQFISSTSNFNKYFQNGNYHFQSITDATGCSMNLNLQYLFDFHSLTESVTQQVYDCDSTKYRIDFLFTGNSPWTVEYKKPLAPSQYKSYLIPASSLWLSDGDWQVVKVTDSTGCSHQLGLAVANTYVPISASVLNQGFDCDSEKVKVHLLLHGNSPWVIHYVKNGTAPVYFDVTTTNADIDMYLPNGNYTFLNVTDATNCNTVLNQNVENNFSVLSIHKNQSAYNCTSGELDVNYQLTGNAPWLLYYKNEITGVIENSLSYDGQINLHLLQGQYRLISIEDATCLHVLSDTIMVDYSQFTMSFISPSIVCDSNKFFVHINHEGGKKPYQLDYTFNGTPSTYIANSDSSILWFADGDYYFDKVSDSIGCEKSIDQSFNYRSLGISSQQHYECDSAKLKLDYLFTGQQPWIFSYRNNTTNQIHQITTTNSAIQFYLPYGPYTMLSVQDANCTRTLNDTIMAGVQPFTSYMNPPAVSCDSSKYFIKLISAGGVKPFKFEYYKNGNLNNFYTYNDTAVFFLDNATYLFNKVTDSIGCEKVFNQSFVSNFHALSAAIVQQHYNCDSNKYEVGIAFNGNAPWHLQYSDGVNTFIKTTYNPSYLLYLSNGNWIIQKVTDSTGCVHTFNETIQTSYFPLTASLVNYFYNCDSNKVSVQFSLGGNSPWTIHYSKNGAVPVYFSYVTSNPNTILYLPAGAYTFMNVQNANCSTALNQTVTNNYHALGIQSVNKVYDCDSAKLKVDYVFTGDGPWIFKYKNNASSVVYTRTTISPSLTLYFSYGQYTVLSLQDANCTKLINDTILLDSQPFQSSFISPAPSCDSNKYFVKFMNEGGKKPYTFSYQKNGAPQTFITYNDTTVLFLQNGFYQFNKIFDSLGCEKIINQNFTANFQSLSANIVQQFYNCDSNKYEIDFAFTGNAPWKLSYTDGTNTIVKITYNPSFILYLGNGNWNIQQVKDSTECVHVFNANIVTDFYPINASIINQNYDCDSNKMKVLLSLSGNYPWTVYYVKTGTSPVNYSFVTTNPNPAIYLAQGVYTFINVVDATGCNAVINQTIVNSSALLSVQNSSEFYNCDSNKYQLNYLFTGESPWIIEYKNNATGALFTKMTYTSSCSLYLSNGNYTILNVYDMNCMVTLNDTVDVNFTPLNSIFMPKVIDCDSDKYFVKLISTGGKKPYTYSYQENGLPRVITTSVDTTTLYLSNGNYIFNSVTDSLGCTIVYNQLVHTDYEGFQFNSVSSKYLCDVDSTEVTFDVSNLQPLWMNYTRNGGINDTLDLTSQHVFRFSNGAYQWLSVFDSVGCIDAVQTSTLIDYTKISCQPFAVEKNCDEKEYNYHLNLQGNLPMKLYYTFNSVSDSLLLNTFVYDWKPSPGNYNLIQLKDKENCDLMIGKSDTLEPFMPGNATLILNDKEFTVMPAGYFYYWMKDGVVINSTTINTMPTRGDGLYSVVIRDKAGCDYTTNSIMQSFPNNINVYPNPAHSYTSILINDNYGKHWDYSVFDVSGNTILKGSETKAYKDFDLQGLAVGLYNVIIVYEYDLTRHTVRLIKY